jgi:hypothetical protein
MLLPSRAPSEVPVKVSNSVRQASTVASPTTTS